MTRMEALKAMIDGEKVRDVTWLDGKYMYMDEDHIIRDSEGSIYGYYRFVNEIYSELSNEWEVYYE